MLRKSLQIVLITLLLAVAMYAQGTAAATEKPATTIPAATPTPAPATEPAKKAPIFRPTADQIMAVQKLLKEKKLYSGDADGKYNDETHAGIKAYQKDNGLKATGGLNRATLEKMGVPLTDKQKETPVSPASFDTSGSPSTKTTKTSTTDKPATTSSSTKTSTSTDGPKRPAPFSADKDQIIALQKVLKDGKMFAGEANGERSDELKDAVKKYQEANGLKATGGINGATLQKAGITLTDKQKAQMAAQAAYDAAKKN